MPKDTKKKANPALEDDEVLEDEEETTDADEAEDETETDTDEADEADEEEDEEEPVKKPAKASKTGKATKTTKTKAKAEVEEDEDADDGEEKPLIQREAPKRRSASSIEAEISRDQQTVKAALAKQPKVRIFIPLGIGEKKGSPSAYESVTINGYRMVLPKGEYCTVPQGVADIIEAHYNMTPENTAMGEAFRLDRPRVKDGMSTDEALG